MTEILTLLICYVYKKRCARIKDAVMFFCCVKEVYIYKDGA